MTEKEWATHAGPARWEPWPLTLACSSDCRSPDCLRACVGQFDVEHNPRYRRDELGHTYCNCALWDFTRALECEIPHWVSGTGAPVPVGKGRELTAPGMIMWLRVYGDEYGWKSLTDPSEAMAHAAAGRPVVVAWENPKITGTGQRAPSHVAIMLPPVDGQARIAQAGADNFFDGPVERGFGKLRDLLYWWHE